MNSSTLHPSERVVAELIHELRQPLSNIGLCASYLGLILGGGHERAHDQIHTIQEQVERASLLLNRVASELRAAGQRSQQLAENLDSTKAGTAAVT